MKLDDCIEKGLIRKDPSVKNRVEGSMETAERFIGSAKNALTIEEYELCIIAGYNSLFHSARALLFRKEYDERSHFGLFTAVESLYSDESISKHIKAIQKVRSSRHKIQYQGEFGDKDEAEYVISLAEKFLNASKQNLEIK